MSRSLESGLAILSLVAWASSAQGQIFSDDLSSGANWTVLQDSDASAVFGFDYAAKGVPAAPNGSDTIGLKFEVNNNSPGDVNWILAANSNAAYTGQFTFRVDAWINWAPVGGTTGTGTTEFIGAAVGNDIAAAPLGGAFIYSSDGDSGTTDYRMYKENVQLQSESGQYAAGNVDGARDNINPYYTNAFPSIDIATAVPTQGTSGTHAAGAGGFQWMTINFEVDTEAIGPAGNTTDLGSVRVSMRSASSGNTIEIGVIDNSNEDTPPAILEGAIGLLMTDLFTSVTVDPNFSFGLFDNVTVLSGLVPLDDDRLAGDFDDSKFVDGVDFILWQRDPNIGSLDDWEANFGTGSNSVSAVPEPATLLLLLVASCLAVRRSR